MSRPLFAAFVLYLSFGRADAQAPQPVPPPPGAAFPAPPGVAIPAPPPPAPSEPPPSYPIPGWESPETWHQTWIRTEYLAWRVKDAPLPVPLVTTGNPAAVFPFVNTAGAIGQAGTQVLFGGQELGYGQFNGMRLTVGAWLGPSKNLAWETNAFFFERRSNNFQANSDAAGNPPLYLPTFNVVANQERALPIADPLRGISGSVAAPSTLQLWGGESNLVIPV